MIPFTNKRKKEEAKLAVVVENEGVSKDSDEPRTAFFDIRSAGTWAGNWIMAVKQVLEQRFEKVELIKTDKEKASSDGALKDFRPSLKQVSPMNFMNEQVKNKVKTMAQENSRQITISLIEAAIYCAIFNEAKTGLKRLTRDRRYAGPTVKYVSDVMLPTGLYGPIVGFLVRLALPI